MTSKIGLVVQCFTCTNNLNGLFDFDSKNLIKQTFKLKSKDEVFSWEMYDYNNRIYMVEDARASSFVSDNQSAHNILRVSYNLNEFKIHSPSNSNGQASSSDPDSNVTWVIYSENIMKKLNCRNRKAITPHRLVENDVIKFGRVKLSVKYIITGRDITPTDLNLNGLGFLTPNNDCTDDDPVDKENDSMKAISPATSNTLEEKSTPKSLPNLVGKSSSLEGMRVCRICLCCESEEGPLITPCNCKGTLNYIHLECLRMWIKGRLSMAKEDETSFFWKELCCELCGEPYPTVLHIDDKETNLINVKKPDPPYLVLEMGSEGDGGCFVVSVAKNKVNIGRGHQSDVRLQDISVSRLHASIEYKGGDILINDHQSKFGTLVMAKPPFTIPVTEPVCIQIGQSILLMSTKEIWSFKWPSCLKYEIGSINKSFG